MDVRKGMKKIVEKYAWLDPILKAFPESHYDGFTIDWKNLYKHLLDGTTGNKYRFLYGLGCNIDCANSLIKRTKGEDQNVIKAAELLTKLGEEMYEYISSLPVCIKFSPSTYEEGVLEIEKLKKQFFTEDAFGKYSKGCDNLAQPNVYESARIEFGRLEKGGWVRTNIAKATHVGIYFDSSYLGARYIQKEGIEKIYKRDLSSHRRRHIFAFIIRKKEGEYTLKSVDRLKEALNK